MINEIYGYASSWKAIVEKKALSYNGLSHDMSDVDIVVYNATWCPDCERETTELMALLMSMKDKAPKVKLISYEDKLWYKEHKSDLPILGVPTFMFYRNKRLLGQIVERSEENLLENIQRIIRKS